MICFNPLDRVKFVQIIKSAMGTGKSELLFQSPRSGQICSNEELRLTLSVKCVSFNPLDRVKFVQIDGVMKDADYLLFVSIP